MEIWQGDDDGKVWYARHWFITYGPWRTPAAAEADALGLKMLASQLDAHQGQMEATWDRIEKILERLK